MGEHNSQIIATRTFFHGDERVIIHLYAPVKTSEGIFKSKIECVGLPNLIIRSVPGIDEFQSLINSLESIRQALLPYGDILKWEGSNMEGEFGFPLIPVGAYIWGKEFKAKFEALVTSEIESRAREEIERGTRKLDQEKNKQ